MMRIERCFLDIDGVLADFTEGVCRAFGLNYKKLYQEDAFNTWNWNRRLGISDEEMDAACNIDFWAGLRPTSDWKGTLWMLEKWLGTENTFLLTTPMPNPGSWTGKKLWVDRYVPQYSKRLIISPAKKHLYAKPGVLLVDDNQDNVINFMEHGGETILVQRPWNFGTTSVQQSINYIQEKEDIVCQG